MQQPHLPVTVWSPLQDQLRPAGDSTLINQLVQKD